LSYVSDNIRKYTFHYIKRQIEGMKNPVLPCNCRVKLDFFTRQAKLDFSARHDPLLPARRGRLSRPDSADFSAVRLKLYNSDNKTILVKETHLKKMFHNVENFQKLLVLYSY
jgi:hypothetical protein